MSQPHPRAIVLTGFLPAPLLALVLATAGAEFSTASLGFGSLGFWLYLALAEVVAAVSAYAEKACEVHSRPGILEEARRRGILARGEQLLERLPTYLLSVRVTRFLGKAALVVGLASWLLGGQLEAADGAGGGFLGPVSWGRLAAVLGLAFVLNFTINDVLIGMLARRRPDAFLLSAVPVLEVLRVLSAPLRIPLTFAVRVLLRVSLEQAGPGARAEVLETVEEGQREGTFTATEADMIESIIDLPSTTVAEVLIPRAQVSMLPAHTLLTEAIAFVHEDGHSRVPVYGKDKDDVLGILNVRDLLAHAGRESAQRMTVREVMRPATFVPETKPLHDLLKEMQSRRVHLAVVLNELRGTAGVVSIEDLLEQIVGDIHDEYDVVEPRAPSAEEARQGALDLDAGTAVDEANRTLHLHLPVEAEYDTLGGLLLHRLGRVPQTGERLELAGVTITVTEADERRIKRLRLEVHAPSARRAGSTRRGGVAPSE